MKTQTLQLNEDNGIKMDWDFNIFENSNWGEIKNKEVKENLRENAEVALIKKSVKEREYYKRVNSLNKLIENLPNKNEIYYILSQGKFDYYQIVPFLVQKFGVIQECYLSTWTLNNQNTDNFIELIKNDTIKVPNLFIGEYLYQREPQVFAKIQQFMNSNGYQFKVFKNHAKIINLLINNNYYVILGSANFTSNPRLEQLTITNSEEAYNFYKDYLDGIKTFY